MSRDEIQKLLGGYATGTLTPEEQQALFAAALEDQQLFDELMREQALRDVLDDPAARGRLLAALDAPEAQSWLARWWRPLSGIAAVAVAAAVLMVTLRHEPQKPPVTVAEVQHPAAPATASPAPAGTAPAASPAASARVSNLPALKRDTAAPSHAEPARQTAAVLAPGTIATPSPVAEPIPPAAERPQFRAVVPARDAAQAATQDAAQTKDKLDTKPELAMTTGAARAAGALSPPPAAAAPPAPQLAKGLTEPKPAEAKKAEVLAESAAPALKSTAATGSPQGGVLGGLMTPATMASNPNARVQTVALDSAAAPALTLFYAGANTVNAFASPAGLAGAGGGGGGRGGRGGAARKTTAQPAAQPAMQAANAATPIHMGIQYSILARAPGGQTAPVDLTAGESVPANLPFRLRITPNDNGYLRVMRDHGAAAILNVPVKSMQPVESPDIPAPPSGVMQLVITFSRTPLADAAEVQATLDPAMDRRNIVTAANRTTEPVISLPVNITVR